MVAFHVLTIPVTPLDPPVIVSVGMKFPDPPRSGAESVMVGATVYPAPACVR